MTLTLMSQLTDFSVFYCFKTIFFVLMDTFEVRQFILGQIAYTLKCNGVFLIKVSMPMAAVPINIIYPAANPRLL